MNIEEYKNLLKSHNWEYFNSDDSHEYETGLKEHNNLIRLASIEKEFRKAYFEEKIQRFSSGY